MVDSKENYKFDLGVKGLKKKEDLTNQQRQTTKWNKHKNKEI